MDLTPFDFDLPEAQIALRPVEPRDTSRLLVVHGDGRLEDRVFRDLPDILLSADMLVFNDTRVLPAALKAIRPARDEIGHDIKVDLNLVEPIDEDHWRALARPGRRLRRGDRLIIADGFETEIMAKHEGGYVDISFDSGGRSLREALEAYGSMPLPPYIARRRAADKQDRTDYQTRFASDDAASVAAPTAGLHFTPELLQRLAAQSQPRETVRLNVGLGTFAPLTDNHWKTGTLHEEWREVSTITAGRLNDQRARGGRIIPVGTTSMRTLESAWGRDGIQAVKGPTDIFLRPGDPIHATDGLITNFHLPKSSLFMLVSALMGTDTMQSAYAHAIREGYRFYSYGDACLLLP
ncbi:MAG: tRNA preQ1(34) S-adenosylmethionine ribosyltransferase-isomerase QueA [Pseudomonadota bacterium]